MRVGRILRVWIGVCLGCWLVWVWLLGVLELYNDLVTFWGLGLCLVCGCGMILV